MESGRQRGHSRYIQTVLQARRKSGWCELFKINSVYNNKAISSNRKVATNCDSGTQPMHLGYDNR